MTFPTRRLLAAAMGAGMGVAPALAQPAQPVPGWPERPVRLVLPAAGGAGTADTLARIMAAELDKRLPQRSVVDNRPGANGNVGAGVAARSAADGYTFLWSWAGTLATNPAMYASLPFDPLRDFEPVILIGNVPNILIVTPDFPARSLEEFTRHVRAHPGQLSYGSSGIGSSMHMAAALYSQATGAEMTHVPYNGLSQAVADLFTGRIQLMFNLITGSAPQVREGRARAIAVLSDRRSPVLPDVPTTAELGMPGLEFGTWFGLLAPRGTPQPIIQAMNRLFNEILAEPESRARFEAQGLDVMGGPPERLTQHLTAELRRHAEIVRFANVRME
ncbi:MAG: tripartite tricarboxylate transporter substrate binding protein [Acetobacteraceae bacterium]|nr:tripartite tricarboxylate transporter substrate binding protein [Acetobacteraceae bacterium]